MRRQGDDQDKPKCADLRHRAPDAMGKGCGYGERWEGDRRSGGGADGSAAGAAAVSRGSAERWDREAAARAPQRRPSVRDEAGGEEGRGGRHGRGGVEPAASPPGRWETDGGRAERGVSLSASAGAWQAPSFPARLPHTLPSLPLSRLHRPRPGGGGPGRAVPPRAAPCEQESRRRRSGHV